MTATLSMIRRLRDIQNERAGIQTGIASLFDIRLGRLMSYMRHRHFRDTGYFSPI